MNNVEIIARGPVGCGKSAVLGEIEIALRALGLSVSWKDEENARAEKYLTHADWIGELERTQPAVVLTEEIARPAPDNIPAPFQQRVQPWMAECFGPMIAGDREERNHRFLEVALELIQSTGCTASEAHQLVDYVYGRPVGEPAQEVGGVMVTLAALCLANGLDMHQCGETELARIWTKVEQIRAKQAAKPKHSPLSEQVPAGIQALSESQINDLYLEPKFWLHGQPEQNDFLPVKFARAILAARQPAPPTLVPGGLQALVDLTGQPATYGDVEVTPQPARLQIDRINLLHGAYITREIKTAGTHGWLLRNEHGLVRALDDFETEFVDCTLAAKRQLPPREQALCNPGGDPDWAAYAAAEATDAAPAVSQQAGGALGWEVRERRLPNGELADCFVQQLKTGDMPYGLEVLGDDYNGFGGIERKLEHCKMIVAWANAAHPPADAAPAWDTDATKRLRSIVVLLGLQSAVPEGDLTGYEFAALGFVRREIERLTHERDTLAKAISDAALKAGIWNGKVALTGPHLLLFANDLAECAKAAQGEALSQEAGGSMLSILYDLRHYMADKPVGPRHSVDTLIALAQRAASQPIYFGFSDEQAAIEAAKTLSMIGVPLNESGSLNLCHAFLKLRNPGSERDAARYRWLRDNQHGYILEENGIHGGKEMDAFMDEVMAAQQGEKGGA